MHPLLATALADSEPLVRQRGWQPPGDAAQVEAERVLALVLPRWRAPTVEVQPDGSISLEWEAGERGWVQLALQGDGRLRHSAVIDGDEYAQDEPFGESLPDWAQTVLSKLLSAEH